MSSLIEKLRAFDSGLPLERARTIPAFWYTDPEIHGAECRSIFGGCWQAIGRVDQVSRPGSYFTADIAGEPILVLRGEDQVLRAFYNVCRHRAARVAADDCGRVTRLRCRYHGWTYDLCGRLRGTPEFDGVADFSREDNDLTPVHAATWGPLVWVNLGPPAPSVADLLLPLKQTPDIDFGALQFVERREYVLACNWKVFVDNYLDGGYHVNTVHPGLAGVLDYAQYQTQCHGETSVQISPLRPTDTNTTSAALGKVRTGKAAYYWWIFPNFMMNIYQGVMDTNLVLPTGPESCRVIFDFYFADSSAESAFAADSIAVAHQIQLEDIGICEDVQRGLKSRSFETGRFSVRREAAVYHFHRLLAARLAEAATDS